MQRFWAFQKIKGLFAEFFHQKEDLFTENNWGFPLNSKFALFLHLYTYDVFIAKETTHIYKSLKLNKMKTNKLLLTAATMVLMLFVTNVANAQDPFKDLKKNPAVATFRVPDIVDFVTVYLSNPDDELRGSIAPEWQKYLKNEKLSKGVTFTVDKNNGYVRYDRVDKKSNEKSYVEYCYWNCADGLHKLFAENVGITINDKPVFTEFSGLYIYVYDNATQKLYMFDQDLLGLGEETHGMVTFSLPRTGKDIEVTYANGSKKKLTWNGNGFSFNGKGFTPKSK